MYAEKLKSFCIRKLVKSNNEIVAILWQQKMGQSNCTYTLGKCCCFLGNAPTFISTLDFNHIRNRRKHALLLLVVILDFLKTLSENKNELDFGHDMKRTKLRSKIQTLLDVCREIEKLLYISK